MAYKTYDETVLEKKQDFDLTLDISEMYPHKNADGSNPVFTLKVEAPSLMLAINTLTLLSQDDSSELLDILIGDAYNKIDFGGVELTEEEHMIDGRLQEMLTTDKNGFFEIPVSATVLDKNDVKSEVQLTFITPSYMIALHSFIALTSKKNMNGLIASFMPYDEDF